MHVVGGVAATVGAMLLAAAAITWAVIDIRRASRGETTAGEEAWYFWTHGGEHLPSPPFYTADSPYDVGYKPEMPLSAPGIPSSPVSAPPAPGPEQLDAPSGKQVQPYIAPGKEGEAIRAPGPMPFHLDPPELRLNLSNREKHHLLPQQYREIFKKAEIDIDALTKKIGLKFHHRLHNEGWNQMWEQFLGERGGKITELQDVFDFMHELEKMYPALERRPFVRWRK